MDSIPARAGHFRTRVFIAFQEAPTQRLATVVLRRMNGQYALSVRVRRDDGTRPARRSSTSPTPRTRSRSTGGAPRTPGANDGGLGLWIDGVAAPGLSGLDNDGGQVDFARLGALSVKTGAAGTLFWDGFESRRRTYIGP